MEKIISICGKDAPESAGQIGDPYRITDGEGRELIGRIIKVAQNGVYVQFTSDFVGVVVTFEPYPPKEEDSPTNSGRIGEG